jgi:hypothetical protein
MGNWDWESIKGFIPIILIFVVGGAVVYFGGRKPTQKPDNAEKN